MPVVDWNDKVIKKKMRKIPRIVLSVTVFVFTALVSLKCALFYLALLNIVDSKMLGCAERILLRRSIGVSK